MAGHRWRRFPGWFVNSIGCFTRADRNYSVVVLTQGNPTMGYGVATVEDVGRGDQPRAEPRRAARHPAVAAVPVLGQARTSPPRAERAEGAEPRRARTVATAAAFLPGPGPAVPGPRPAAGRQAEVAAFQR